MDNGPKIFKTFVRNGIKFAALPCGNGNVFIIDELGNSYGSWMDIFSFYQHYPAGAKIDPIGKAMAKACPVRDTDELWYI